MPGRAYAPQYPALSCIFFTLGWVLYFLVLLQEHLLLVLQELLVLLQEHLLLVPQLVERRALVRCAHPIFPGSQNLCYK